MFDTFIFVPAYNVEKTLEDVLNKIPESVWNRSQILVINDGSKDGTKNVVLNFIDKVKPVRLLDFKINCGYGTVVKNGITEGLASGAKYIACLHGDGQYPAHMLDIFLEHLENKRASDGRPFAILQGSRHAVAGGAKAGKMPLHKRLGGAFLTWLENLVFRQKLTDRHSGFILYSADFLRTVNLERLSASFDIDLELISIADARGLPVGELPIPTVYDGETSNLNVVNYGLRCLRQIARRAIWTVR